MTKRRATSPSHVLFLITLNEVALVHINAAFMLAGGTVGGHPRERWLGSPQPPWLNIPGGESRMTRCTVQYAMINLSGSTWLSVIWNPLSLYLLHNAGYLLQLSLRLFLGLLSFAWTPRLITSEWRKMTTCMCDNSKLSLFFVDVGCDK